MRGDAPENFMCLRSMRSKAIKRKSMIENCLLAIILVAARIAFLCGIPGYIENPAESRIWRPPAMCDFSKIIGAHVVETTFCSCGIQLCKPTKFFVWSVPREFWTQPFC